MAAPFAASVGETSWSEKAFTGSPRQSFSTTCVAKVGFAPGRPLNTTSTRATAQSGTSASARSSPWCFEIA
jgi:hypothetical protein